MFPNPQDALLLPPNPNLEQYKKLARSALSWPAWASSRRRRHAVGDSDARHF